VIGPYIAYVLPVFLRWRMGDAFVPGPWTLGRKYRWISPAAIIWVAICVIIFILPFNPAGVPWREEFDWKYVNYAPITVGGVLLVVGLWWHWGARHTFTGPIRTVEFDDAAGVVEPEAGDGSAHRARAGACGTTRRCCCRARIPRSSARAGWRSLPPDPSRRGIDLDGLTPPVAPITAST
jgi:hypothetical protein